MNDFLPEAESDRPANPVPDVVNVYQMGDQVPWEPEPGATKFSSTKLPASSLLRAALPHHSQINFTKIPHEDSGAFDRAALAAEINKSVVRENVVIAEKDSIAETAQDLSQRGLAKEASRVIILIPSSPVLIGGDEDEDLVMAVTRAITWFEALDAGIYAISEDGAIFPI